MTIIIGVLCQDGAVVGADTTVTTTNTDRIAVAKDTTQKIRVFEEHCAVFTHCGEGGDGQRLERHFRNVAREVATRRRRVSIVDVAELVQKGVHSAFAPYIDGVQHAFHEATSRDVGLDEFERFYSRVSGSNGCIFTIPTSDGPAIIAVEGGGRACWHLSPPRETTVVMGSGDTIGLPFLLFVRRVVWDSQIPFVDDAVLGVLWTIQHAIGHAVSGVGGEAQIAVMRDGERSAQMLGPEELGVPKRLIEEIEESMRDVGRRGVHPDDAVPSPPDSPSTRRAARGTRRPARPPPK